MPSLQVREVPAEIYGALKLEAERQHRSLAQQAIVALAHGLGMGTGGRERRRGIVQSLKAEPLAGAGKALPRAVGMIREDRAR